LIVDIFFCADARPGTLGCDDLKPQGYSPGRAARIVGH